MKSVLAWMKTYRKWLIGILLIAAVAYGYFRDTPAETISTAPKTVTVLRGDLEVVVSGSGQVEALSQVDLTPVIAGDGIDVISVRVKNNQLVKKGQVIAVLDTSDAVRETESATLNLRNAQIRQKQTEDLYSKQTKTDLWNRQLEEVAIAQSQNALRKAQEKLRDYSIKAPFDGIVTGLGVEVGDSVARNTVLASVITPDRKIVITLNEVDAARVVEGNSVRLSFNALPGVFLGGRVSRIATIGMVTQNVVVYEADITLDEQNEALKPGMSVSADIFVAEKKGVLLLPNAALRTDANHEVTVVKASPLGEGLEARAEERKRGEARVPSQVRDSSVVKVEIGLTNDIDTEILSGVSEGERVVLPSTSPGATATGGNVLSSLFRGAGRGNR